MCLYLARYSIRLLGFGKRTMVGDPCYLDEWDTNKNDEWNLEGKSGDYSYNGVGAFHF